MSGKVSQGKAVHIRTFSQNDRKPVISLWEACGLLSPWTDPDYDISAKILMQPEGFIVGVINGQLMASAMVEFDGQRGSVFNLAVLPEYQTAGFGKQMMQHVETILSRVGCPKLNIIVRNASPSVLAFYEAMGYQKEEISCVGMRLILD